MWIGLKRERVRAVQYNVVYRGACRVRPCNSPPEGENESRERLCPGSSCRSSGLESGVAGRLTGVCPLGVLGGDGSTLATVVRRPVLLDRGGGRAAGCTMVAAAGGGGTIRLLLGGGLGVGGVGSARGGAAAARCGSGA